jgi:hypothetical protein
MEGKIFKQLFLGVDEKYIERAFEKIKKDGCPEGEDLLVWVGKLVEAERKSNAEEANDGKYN